MKIAKVDFSHTYPQVHMDIIGPEPLSLPAECACCMGPATSKEEVVTDWDHWVSDRLSFAPIYSLKDKRIVSGDESDIWARVADSTVLGKEKLVFGVKVPICDGCREAGKKRNRVVGAISIVAGVLLMAVCGIMFALHAEGGLAIVACVCGILGIGGLVGGLIKMFAPSASRTVFLVALHPKDGGPCITFSSPRFAKEYARKFVDANPPTGQAGAPG